MDNDDWWEQDLTYDPPEPPPFTLDDLVAAMTSVVGSYGKAFDQIGLAVQGVIKAYRPMIEQINELQEAFAKPPPPTTGPRVQPFQRRGMK